ncbi:RagB/SusD family nutrient uptake outer membrane protein [Robertkochia sediminum]|uniref:RagB/SusD family nutrient uptake outer membrane protein n=1 Tax=Robertkochia sediminum TaxID=2785326 RepID=UPI0019330D58|nr:RagB/SusD family nutrient uptake outer membrane protein [Robertkochia sediminum]MBL7474102.1 RagB/SusD family nutrient uptake outer membrane protein [Robertkochia sediminum]
MKLIKIIVAAILFVNVLSCSDDFLSQPPLDRVTENDVWNDKNLMDAYLFKIYDRMVWDYLEDFWGVGGSHRDALSDLARGTYSWTALNNVYRPGNWGTANNTWPTDWWGYDVMWKINYSLENIANTPGSVLTDEERNNRLGELHFLRAYAYFDMVKRYGGVPIILEAQDPKTTPQEELFPERNTEKEVYDQILADAQIAFDLLPEVWSAQRGRASRWAAKALESRAALYAGSIARYGTVQLDGVVGIPAGDAETYYRKALEASQQVINESGHILFNKYPDPSENYARLFLDETEDETIFSKLWIPFEKGHSYDLHNVPFSYRVDWGASMSPTKQLLDSYEMLDTGLLPEEAGSGYDENDPFANRDPRMKGTLLTNLDTFQGSPVEVWYGTERDGAIDTERGTGVGKDGLGIHPDATKTGFYIRKYLQDGGSPLFIQEYYSGTDCIIFRLGEIYLNGAEAAIELNDESLARDLIEPLRRRAGLQQNLRLEPYAGTALRDRIRNERKLELAFEDHRYWDVRRWRIATEVLSIQVEGIRTLRHIDGFGNETFTYETFDAEATPMRFDERHYYFPIGQSRTNNNPKLVENPLY